jgi:enoyl-CoA hydratase/carnithine racemase
MTYQHLLCSADNGILTITLSRPSKLNSTTYAMLRDFSDALRVAGADDNIKAVIVTGAGRAFCSGTDLSDGESGYPATGTTNSSSDEAVRDAGGVISLQLFEFDKPVIGAVNGLAVGYGATMTLPMDMRIASTQAKFSFIFARRGLMPEACSTWFLPRIVGISRALEWVETGRFVSAEEAKEAGLVRDVCAPDQLLRDAHQLAFSLVESSSPVSVTASRRAIMTMLTADTPRRAHELESQAIAMLRTMPDFQEGVAAFREKRGPRFAARSSLRGVKFPWDTDL